VLESVGIASPECYLGWTQFKEILDRCCLDRDRDGAHECAGAISTLALDEWLMPFWQRGGRLDQRDAFFNPQAIEALDDLWAAAHLKRTLPLGLPSGEGEFVFKLIRQRFEMERLALRWISSQEVYRDYAVPSRFLLARFEDPQIPQCSQMAGKIRLFDA
jgi:hypothetical protein